MTTLDHRELSTVFGGRSGQCHKGGRGGPGGQMGGHSPRGRRPPDGMQGGPGGGMQPAASQGGDPSGDSGGGAMPMTQGGGSPPGATGGGSQIAQIVGQMSGLMQQLQSAVR